MGLDPVVMTIPARLGMRARKGMKKGAVIGPSFLPETLNEDGLISKLSGLDEGPCFTTCRIRTLRILEVFTVDMHPAPGFVGEQC